MHLDTDAVDHYLAHGVLATSWTVRAAAGGDTDPVLPPAHERDAVRALRDDLVGLLDPFAPAHPDAWAAVSPDWHALVAGAHVALVVGWPEPYDAGVRTAPDGRDVVVLDVARLAGYGHDTGLAAARAVLDHEVAHVLVARCWPADAAAGYRDRLDRLVFDEGLAHHLGMRGHPALAPTSPALEGRRRAAQDALRSARDLADPDAQRAALLRAAAADDFWDKFGCVAGVLAFADSERSGGLAGLAALAGGGWRGFVDRVLGGAATVAAGPDPSRVPGARG
ncbi:hypothetical protein MHY85_20225 [Cellulomonas sp. ACRRI]|uniref:hypothetical protein n=1 Tax=Cellulomonas sp. ACRRI TaxID=2918188 RepID=UPI001EF18CCF|nr:hypothetical protein [Cellulomonas sp. ACRRI]MCG7288284.1 hypothetical protein [Cellulomonas sp. ACRRI]